MKYIKNDGCPCPGGVEHMRRSRYLLSPLSPLTKLVYKCQNEDKDVTAYRFFDIPTLVFG